MTTRTAWSTTSPGGTSTTGTRASTTPAMRTATARPTTCTARTWPARSPRGATTASAWPAWPTTPASCPLKFIGPDGGYTSDAVEAIHYAVVMGARVINASFGSTEYAPALCDAIAEAGAEGVVVVAAAGNDGTDNDASAFWPANCPATTLLSVAATTQSDGLASFSNRGRGAGGPGRPRQPRPEHPPRERVRLPQRDLDGRAARHRGRGRRAGREPGPGSLAGGHGDRGRGRPHRVAGDDHRDRAPPEPGRRAADRRDRACRT